MTDLTKYSSTELLKMINDSKINHDKLKEEIIQDTKKIDDITIIINKNLKKLEDFEKDYIILIEEMNNR